MLLLSHILFKTKLWHFIIEQERFFIFVPVGGLLGTEQIPVVCGKVGLWDEIVSLYLSDPINRLIMEEQL